MRRPCWSIVAVLSLLLVQPPGATAGGWATAALVEAPGPITVDTPFMLRYVVRAHGIAGHEMERMETTLQFTHRDSEQVVESVGKATANPEVYEATATLPAAGVWKWAITIHNFGDADVESPMPSLAATEAGQPFVSGAATTSGMTVIVRISDSGFSPATLEIKAGDTITWVNEGLMAHQVASDALAFETSPMLQPGEAFFQTIAESGTYDYLCPPHPSMTGKIVVT